MSKLIFLNLGRGDLQHGFPSVSAQLEEDTHRHRLQVMGSLPAAPELFNLYRRWQLLYELLYEARSLSIRGSHLQPNDEDIRIDEEPDVTHVSEADFYEIGQELQNHIDSWLDSEEFSEIYRQLQQRLDPSQEIRVIIQTDDNQLRKLPWHIWRFFKDYPRAEVSLSPLNIDTGTTTRNSTERVSVLAILGDSAGIDIESDRRLLENLPDAKTLFLVEPQRRELNEQLWDRQGWDILFFAGHSLTQADGETGCIYLNPEESLTITQLRNALHEAIERGLQLAIFNSCDGLGLARQLADLHIPQMIVMREPVPDLVAQEFLKYFLTEFAGGRSFNLAVRKAREKLQGLEGEFPGASWLPVIFQNPAEVPPTWEALRQPSPIPVEIIPKQGDRQSALSPQPKLLRVFLTSLIITGLLMGVRLLGLLQSWELKAFDQLMRLRPAEEGDERLLIVEVTKEDIQQLGDRYPLSDAMMLRLLRKLDDYKPQTIGLDIYRDVPEGKGRAELLQYLQQHKHIISPCVHPEGKNSGIQPPPGISNKHVGFVDSVEDPDGIIRRHLLAVDPPDRSPCSANYALSAQLALYYLESKGKFLKLPTVDSWKIGSTNLELLNAHKGFYQQRNLTRGYQILLNYRFYNSLDDIAKRVTLTQVLTDRVNPKLISDRIILIGVTDPRLAKDDFYTPYNQEIRGLQLQAQMASQLVNAVAEQRLLLQFWPLWGDLLWIGAWSVVGGLVIWRFGSRLQGGLIGGVALIFLWGSCFILLLTKGVLVPLIPSGLALIMSSGIIAVNTPFRY